jgi:ribonuclease HI
MKEIHIFTDGATPNNQNKSGNRRGGVGVFFGDDDTRNISFGMIENEKQKVTNNVCELTACIRALEKIMSTEKIIGKQIVIYTDSMYIVNTIANWASGWEKNGWKKDGGKISNLDLVKKLYYYSINFGIIYRHVDAHTTEPDDKESKEWKLWYGNMMADKLAVDGAKKVSFKKSD